jgi:hypothetical protein
VVFTSNFLQSGQPGCRRLALPESEVSGLITQLDYAVDVGNSARLVQRFHDRIVKQVSLAGKYQSIFFS